MFTAPLQKACGIASFTPIDGGAVGEVKKVSHPMMAAIPVNLQQRCGGVAASLVDANASASGQLAQGIDPTTVDGTGTNFNQGCGVRQGNRGATRTTNRFFVTMQGLDLDV